jgi:hypothetical protein
VSDSIEPPHRRLPRLLIALAALVVALGVVGWFLWRDSGAESMSEALQSVLGGSPEGVRRKPTGPEEIKVPEVKGLTEQAARGRLEEADLGVEVRHRESPEEDAGRVLEQSVPGGKEVEKGSKILLTVGEGLWAARVPNLVGLSYTEAENRLKQSGFLLGGVVEAPSDTVPAGVVMKQDPSPGTEQNPNSYVYLTTSVGPSEGSSASGGQVPGATGTQNGASSGASSKAAVAAAVQGHYEAIGAGSFEEAYSYFGPTLRSQQDEASWITGEESSQIQSTTINSLEVNEVSGNTATATVDVSSVNKTETARFHIVWRLVKEGGVWKLDQQLSGQRIG